MRCPRAQNADLGASRTPHAPRRTLLGHLIRRESRDARWHVAAAALAVTVLVPATYAVQAWRRGDLGFDDRDGAILRVWVVLATALGGGSIAADAFAGDATSRRIDASALLPTGLGRVFAAKAIVVVASAVLLGAWAAAWSPVAACLFNSPATALGAASALPHAPTLVLLALVAVAATCLLACVLEHALGAILGALVAVGGAYFSAARFAPWEDWGLTRHSVLESVGLTAVTASLLAATGVAFVHGPIHLGRRVRRAALGLGVAGAALFAGGSASVAVLEARAVLAPGDADLVVLALNSSPDGRTALVLVGSERVPAQCHAWLVDVPTGRITTLPGRYRVFESWTADGGVRLRAGVGRGNQRVWERIDTFDVATGALRRVRSEEQGLAEPWVEGWARFAKTTQGHVVEWPERGLRRQLDAAWAVAAAPRAGRVIAWFPGRVRVLELDTGVEHEVPSLSMRGDSRWIDGDRLRYRGDDSAVRVLDCATGASSVLAPPSGAWGMFGDAHWAAYWPSGMRGVALADVRDGRTVAGPWPDRTAAFVPGNGRYAVVWNPRATGTAQLVDCETGRACALDVEDRGTPPSNLVRGLADGRLLVVRRSGALDVADADADANARTIRNVATIAAR
jgi:hypothetical protein